MWREFKISYALWITYWKNGILYMLKHTPIIKRFLPSSLYKSGKLKIFATVLATIAEIGSVFLGKLIYMLFMLLVPVFLLKGDMGINFFNIAVFMGIAGGITINSLYTATKDQYYAIMILKFDPKRYLLLNYGYSLLKTFVGYIPVLCFGIIRTNGSFLYLPIVLVVTISAKLIYSMIRTKRELKPIKLIYTATAVVICMVFAYVLPFCQIELPFLFYVILTLVFVAGGVYSAYVLLSYDNYKMLSRRFLTNENVFEKLDTKEVMKKSLRNQISDDKIEVAGSGYKYFNEIFMKRHKKYLIKTTNVITLIAAIVFLGNCILLIVRPEFIPKEKKLLSNNLTYFLFIMYMINRGQNITQYMYMNCDHSMLSYRFYRRSSDVLELFTERLKMLVAINLKPALVISLGLILTQIITKTNYSPFNCFITLLMIVSMSVFFSVHYLVLYYLLQPYNMDLKLSNPVFSTCRGLTYVVCFVIMQMDIKTIPFAIGTIGFTFLYCMIALLLAYKIAPKTFKIRV